MSATTDMMVDYYDYQQGFNDWLHECRGQYRRGMVPPGYSLFYNYGVDRLQSLNTAQVEQTLAQLKRLQNDDRSTWTDPHAENIRFDWQQDASWIQPLKQQILNADMDRILVNFFQSEYMIHSLYFHRTFPAAEGQDVSYLWHRDAGPTAHLKIITYFTSGAETGAGTEALDINQTNLIEQAGYAFPDLKDRTADLGPYIDQAGIVYRPPEKTIEPGESLVFRPRDVLHRGIFSNNPDVCRYAMTMVIVPSTVHWHEADAKWPLFAQQRMMGMSIDTRFAPVIRGEAKVTLPGQ